MVDATDAFTPESALSAATKIKIYGKRRAATTVAMVSSGTGSLTNDIIHVGASALGLYTIALAKADLSDASAAWYDQYIISLSATGAAYQALVVDGGIDESYVSDVLSRLSNVVSYLSNMQSNLSGIASDILSSTRGNSDFMSKMSDVLSNVNSMLVAGTFVLGASNLSDMGSAVWGQKYTGHSAASSFGSLMSDILSRVALGQSAASDAYSAIIIVQSRLSDLDSRLASDVSDILSAVRGNSDALSDLLSRINSASFLSDIASHVWAAKYTANSAASSFGSLMSDIYSRVALAQSMASDAASGVTVLLVRVPSTLISNINSMLVAGTFVLGTSNLSDIESRVWSADKSDYNASSQMGSLLNAAGGGADPATIAARVWSDYQSKVGQSPSQVFSNLSNYLSYISAVVSGLGAGASASAIADKVWSDYGSKVGVTPSQAYSVLILAASRVSDIQSYLVVMSGVLSDAYSGLSDIRSLLTAYPTGGVELAPSTMSDLRSAITAAGLGASGISDIASAVWADAKASQVQSRLSDIYSLLSDTQSDLQSRIPEVLRPGRYIDI